MVEGLEDFEVMESDIDDAIIDERADALDFKTAVMELTAEEKDALRQEIKDIVEGIDTNILKLGGCLYKVLGSKSFLEWGFETFDEYAEYEVKRKRRWCEYIMGVWYAITFKIQSDEIRDRLIAMGTSKAGRLAPHITEENAQELLDEVETLTVAETEGHLRKRRRKEKGLPEEKEELRKVQLELTVSQRDVMKSALEVARAVAGVNGTGEQLSLICTEFLSSHSAPGLAKEELIAAHVDGLKTLTGCNYEPSVGGDILAVLMQEGMSNPEGIRSKIKSTVKGPLTLKEFVIFMESGEFPSTVATMTPPIPAPDPEAWGDEESDSASEESPNEEISGDGGEVQDEEMDEEGTDGELEDE